MAKQQETLQIEGMSCHHCIGAVRDALTETGVEIHNVEIGTAEISYDPETTDRAHIVHAVEDMGYSVPAA